MARRRYELLKHVFTGGRFDDHGIDVDALPELVTFKTLLVETAKEIWRLHNPYRERLPKHFERSLTVKFYEIEPGSACVPLMRELEVDDSLLPFEQPPDELDEAVSLLTEVVHAASADQRLPEGFPKKLLGLFSEYGKTLGKSEAIELLPNKKKGPRARYSARERVRLAEMAQTAYEDAVELTGEIRAADLDGSGFALRLPDGSRVSGKFSPEQEALIIGAFHDHAINRLRVSGRAEFDPDGRLKRIQQVASLSVQPIQPIPYDAGVRPIWEIAQQIGSSVPKEDWARVPSDLSENLDHHLYGKPKERR